MKKAPEILIADRRNLTVLRRVLATVPVENRWYPVLKRNFDQMLQRFIAVGGDPATIVGTPQDSAKCRTLSGLCALILAAFVVLVGALSGPLRLVAGLVAALLFLLATALWISARFSPAI